MSSSRPPIDGVASPAGLLLKLPAKSVSVLARCNSPTRECVVLTITIEANLVDFARVPESLARQMQCLSL